MIRVNEGNVAQTPCTMCSIAMPPRLILDLRQPEVGYISARSVSRQHPQLFLPTQKELHFFDDEMQTWPDPDLRNCTNILKKPSRTKFAEKPPRITMYWDPAPERVWKYNPNMKMVALLRDPVTRAFSHWAMESARNAESLSCEAITQEQRRALECRPLQDRVHSYVDRGFYSSQIRRLWRFFGIDNVLILRQDWLRKNPQYCLNKVCKHLGTDPMTINRTSSRASW